MYKHVVVHLDGQGKTYLSLLQGQGIKGVEIQSTIKYQLYG